MKLNQLIEASHTNQPDVRVIAAWLDAGLASYGVLDDWADVILNYIADDLYNPSELWAIIDEWNVCIRFIEHTLTTSTGNIISDEQAQRVIGQPRS